MIVSGTVHSRGGGGGGEGRRVNLSNVGGLEGGGWREDRLLLQLVLLVERAVEGREATVEEG